MVMDVVLGESNVFSCQSMLPSFLLDHPKEEKQHFYSFEKQPLLLGPIIEIVRCDPMVKNRQNFKKSS